MSNEPDKMEKRHLHSGDQDPERLAPTTRPWRVVKPVFDAVIAAIALLVLSPVLLLIAVAIKIDSPGPVLFRQPRYGQNGRPIMVSKFRTMKVDQADMGGKTQTRQNDPRVTGLGRFLRSTCLDELPQLWDVLRGRLSLVGPRPHPIDMEIEGQRADRVIEGYHMRHSVKPGITGLAQMKGNRGPVTSLAMGRERILYDVRYAREMSMMLDIKLLLQTLTVPFKRGLSY